MAARTTSGTRRALAVVAWALIPLGLGLMAVGLVAVVKGEVCLPDGAASLAGSASAVTAALGHAGGLCVGRPAAYGRAGELAALDRSWWLTVGSALTLVGVFAWGWRCLYGPTMRRRSRALLLVTLVLVGVDAGENLLLTRGLHSLSDGVLRSAAVLAEVKFALQLPVYAAGLVVFATLAARWVLSATRFREPPPRVVGIDELARVPDADEPLVVTPGRYAWAEKAATMPGADRPAPEPVADEQRRRWINAAPTLPGRDRGGLGICLSGGGIRSAAIALGALQQLRQEERPDGTGNLLQSARYLVSVSGGGYTAGAFQLALQRVAREQTWAWRPDPDFDCTDAASADTVFAPGSVEEDHVRRHGDYLADGAAGWMRALAVLMRCVTMSLALIALTVIVAGQVLAVFYHLGPVVNLEHWRPAYAGGVRAPAFPTPREPTVLVLLGTAVAAMLLWFLHALFLGFASRGLDDPGTRTRRHHLVHAVRIHALALYRGAVKLGVLVLVYAVGFPALVWLLLWLTYLVPTGLRGPLPGAALTGTTLVTWAGALVATLWKRADTIRAVRGKIPTGRIRALGKSVTQGLVVAAVLAFVALVYLELLAYATTTALDWQRWLGAAGWLALPAALLALFWLLFDQTRASLHPFYRSRLASAFAVRRVRSTTGCGATVARPYDPAELTRLDEYGSRADGFPQVVFAASAAVSGQAVAPPGRRAVSFTFSHDFVGGPDVGWVQTHYAYRMAPPLLRRDLTVEAAMAISGAAIASSMGRMSSPASRLLALSNVRLGSWLPNPTYLAYLAAARRGTGRVGRWEAMWMPRLPRVRRLKYQYRELLGVYGGDDRRLVLCTDGGHYENLGLVEALRLGCSTIVVVDGSADHPPLATALGDAITLAWEELGVTVDLDTQRVLGLVPGSGEPFAPEEPLAALNARLSRCAVATGTFTYPDGRTGTLVVAKASLTRDLPYQILTYAQGQSAFPRQATTDQWFDHAQFDAYQALGTHLGRAAAAAYREAQPAPVQVAEEEEAA